MTSKKTTDVDQDRRTLRNEDPISGQAGAHPIGTGVGAAIGGAAAGAAAGSLAGPIGTVAGTIVGGIAGAYAGKAMAEDVNPTIEEAFWREAYPSRPYYRKEFAFERFEPAYRFGWENYDQGNRSWEAREPMLKKKWAEDRWEGEGGSPKLSWEEARLAAKDANDRLAEFDESDSDSDFDDGTRKPR
jgi:hypothetical protein